MTDRQITLFNAMGFMTKYLCFKTQKVPMPSSAKGPSHASSCNRQSISDITQHVAEQITVILPCRDTCKRGTGNQKNFKLCTVSHNSVHISSGNLKHLSFIHTK